MEYASSKGAVQVIDGYNQVLNWVSEWVNEWVSEWVREWVNEWVYCPPATRKAAAPGGSVYCACHAKGSRGPSGDHARRSSSRRLCVLRLPRERQPQRRPHAPQPQRRPRAPQLLQEALCTALCTAPATRKVNHRGLGYDVVPVTFAM